MESKIFEKSKHEAFDICKKVLDEYDCYVNLSCFESGIIEAKKSGNLLTYGHKIKIMFDVVDYYKVKISVTSNLIGIQIIDWGTNTDNENEIIKKITTFIE